MKRISLLIAVLTLSFAYADMVEIELDEKHIELGYLAHGPTLPAAGEFELTRTSETPEKVFFHFQANEYYRVCLRYIQRPGQQPRCISWDWRIGIFPRVFQIDFRKAGELEENDRELYELALAQTSIQRPSYQLDLEATETNFEYTYSNIGNIFRTPGIRVKIKKEK